MSEYGEQEKEDIQKKQAEMQRERENAIIGTIDILRRFMNEILEFKEG